MFRLKEAADANDNEQQHKTENAATQKAQLHLQEYGIDDNFDKEPIDHISLPDMSLIANKSTVAVSVPYTNVTIETAITEERNAQRIQHTTPYIIQNRIRNVTGTLIPNINGMRRGIQTGTQNTLVTKCTFRPSCIRTNYPSAKTSILLTAQTTRSLIRIEDGNIFELLVIWPRNVVMTTHLTSVNSQQIFTDPSTERSERINVKHPEIMLNIPRNFQCVKICLGSDRLDCSGILGSPKLDDLTPVSLLVLLKLCHLTQQINKRTEKCYVSSNTIKGPLASDLPKVGQILVRNMIFQHFGEFCLLSPTLTTNPTMMKMMFQSILIPQYFRYLLLVGSHHDVQNAWQVSPPVRQGIDQFVAQELLDLSVRPCHTMVMHVTLQFPERTK